MLTVKFSARNFALSKRFAKFADFCGILGGVRKIYQLVSAVFLLVLLPLIGLQIFSNLFLPRHAFSDSFVTRMVEVISHRWSTVPFAWLSILLGKSIALLLPSLQSIMSSGSYLTGDEFGGLLVLFGKVVLSLIAGSSILSLLGIFALYVYSRFFLKIDV